MNKKISSIAALLFLSLVAFSQDEELIIDNVECSFIQACVEPAPDNGVFYQWTILDGNGNVVATDSTEQNCFFSDFLQFGQYILQVSAFDDNGMPLLFSTDPTGVTLDYLSEFFSIDDFGGPINGEIISIGAPSCVGDSILCEKVCENSIVQYTFSAVFPGSPDNVYQWNVTGSTDWEQLSNELIEVTWGDIGPGTVQVETFGFCQQSQFFEKCIEVIALPEADFTTVPASANDVLQVCNFQEILFENTSSDASFFEWSFGDGNSSTLASPEHTYEQSGTYEVLLIAKNECMCMDTSSLTVVVDPLETPLLSCIGTICQLDTFTYETDADCSIFNWSVSGNGDVISGGGTSDPFVEVEWTGGTQGEIGLLVDGCNGDFCTAPSMMVIPIMSGAAIISGETIVCGADVENYTIDDYSGTYFNWVVSGGTIISGQGTNQVSVLWDGSSTLPATGSISVDYENCYLECGGDATLAVNIVDDFKIEGDIHVCQGGSSTYESISLTSNTPVNSDWELIDDAGAVVSSVSNSSSFTITFPDAVDNYELVATPVDLNSYCTSSRLLRLESFPKTEAPTGIEGEKIICPGSSYSYTALGNVTDAIYTWTIQNEGNTEITEGTSIVVTWGSTGPYELSVTQTDVNTLPCESDSYSETLDIIPAITLIGSEIVCKEEVTIYETEFTEFARYEWQISPADMAVIIGESDNNILEVQWLKTGNATIEVSQCGQVEVINVSVEDLPEPTASFPVILCENENGSVSTSTLYSAYEWIDENENIVSTDANPQILPGSYNVIVTDVNGCTGNTFFTIESLPLPNSRASSPDDVNVCIAAGEGFPVLHALNSFLGYTWQWYKDGVMIAGAINQTFQTTELGNYTVEITDSNGCMQSSNTLVVRDFCGGGGGPVTCVADGLLDFDFLAGAECNEIVFTNLSTNVNAGSVNWNFGDEEVTNDFSTDNNPTFKYSNAGFYRATLTASVPDVSDPTAACILNLTKVITIPVAARFEIENACPNSEIQFYDISSFIEGESITGWNWNFGDSGSAQNTSTLQNPEHIYTAPGTYTVTLEVIAGSCVSVYQEDIEIHPLPVLNFTPPAVACEGSSVELIPSSSQYIVEWLWDFGDAASGDLNSSASQNGYHIYESAGNYDVVLTATNIYGCTSTFSNSINIQGNTLSGEITTSVPQPMCEGDTTLLTAPTGGTSWLWSTGVTTESVEISSAGIYNVTVYDDFSCSHVTDDIEIRLLPKPHSTIRAIVYDENQNPIDYIYNRLELCEGEEIYLEIIFIPNHYYQWSTGKNGTTISFNTPTGDDLEPGTHLFTVTMSDNFTGCNATVGPFEVIIHEKPEDIEITASPSGVLCADNLTTFTITNPDATLTYIWSNGMLGTTMVTDEPGVYFVEGFNSFGCSQKSNTLEVLEGPDTNFIPDGCLERCLPDTMCLPAIPGVVSYQWFFDGIEITGATSPDLIMEEAGDYHVVLTDANGCTSTSDPLSVEEYIGTGTVETFVFFDENLDGILDPGDTPLEDVNVYLEGIGNSFIDSMLTDVNGLVQFLEVPAGSYLLRIDSIALSEIGLKAYDYEILVNVNPCEEGDGDPPYFLAYPDCEITYVGESVEYCAGTNYFNDIEIKRDTIFEISEIGSDGCEIITTVDATVYDEISFDVDVINSCFQDSNGSISINNISGGNGSYISYIDGVSFTGISSGLGLNAYMIRVEDEMGCFMEQEVLVEEFPELTMNYDLLQSCFNEDNGGIDITSNIESGSTLYLDNGVINPQDFQNLFAGNYTLRLEDGNGCSLEETFSIDENPELVLELSAQESCPESSTGAISIIDMDGGFGNLTATLDGIEITNNEISDLAAGIYTILLEDESECSVETSIEVEALPDLEYSINVPVLNCDEETDLIEIVTDDASINISWEDGSVENTMEISSAGMYQVSITSDCGTVVEQVSVELEAVDDPEVYIPNIFSPNDDGHNDGFHVMMNEDASLENAELMILNRWGEKIYESDQPSLAWDGMFKGKEIQPGVYIVLFTGTIDYCHIKKEHKVHSSITIVK